MSDSTPLPENVEGHCMLGSFDHGDGRVCCYHSRLGMWTYDFANQCLRDHPEPAVLMGTVR